MGNLKKWIDTLIDLNNELRDNADFNDDVKSCINPDNNTLHIHKGIDKIAEEIKVPAVVKIFGEQHPYYAKKFLIYRGIEIFQIIYTKDGVFV